VVGGCQRNRRQAGDLPKRSDGVQTAREGFLSATSGLLVRDTAEVLLLQSLEFLVRQDAIAERQSLAAISDHVLGDDDGVFERAAAGALAGDQARPVAVPALAGPRGRVQRDGDWLAVDDNGDRPLHLLGLAWHRILLLDLALASPNPIGRSRGSQTPGVAHLDAIHWSILPR